MPVLKCADVEPVLPLVADGALDAQADPDLFAHLAECPACQEALAAHDLVTLALERSPAPPRRRPLRFVWPVALAAGLLLAVLVAGALAPAPRADATVAAAPAPAAVPTVAVANATAAPAPGTAAPAAATPDNPVIEVDVAAVPSPVPGRTMYLVRRGDQVVLVDATQPPVLPNDSGSSDAKPATFHRY